MLSKECYSQERIWYGFHSDILYRDVYTDTVVKNTMKRKGKSHSIFKAVITCLEKKMHSGRDQRKLQIL